MTHQSHHVRATGHIFLSVPQPISTQRVIILNVGGKARVQIVSNGRLIKEEIQEGSSKSPKKTRKRMAKTTAADFNNEDYNIRLPERTQLLTQIKEVIDGVPVSPAFWACCQLADMNRLQISPQ